MMFSDGAAKTDETHASPASACRSPDKVSNAARERS